MVNEPVWCDDCNAPLTTITELADNMCARCMRERVQQDADDRIRRGLAASAFAVAKHCARQALAMRAAGRMPMYVRERWLAAEEHLREALDYRDGR